MTFLLVTTLRISVVLGIALPAAAILRRRSAAMSHWVLAAAIATCAAMPALAAALPAWRVDASRYRAAPASRPDPAITTVVSVAQPAATDAAHAIPAAGTSGASPLSRVAASALLASWAAGALAMLSVLGVGFARLSGLGSAASHADARHRAIAADIAEAIGIRREVRLLQGANPVGMATWGAARPSIVLPAAASGWSDARLRMVLYHELAHVCRGDWPVQMLAEVTRAVYWFNPLLWMACRRLRDAGERACDDAVLNGGVQAAEYATHLVELARHASATRAPRPALAMAQSSGLEGRISAMLDTHRYRGGLSPRTRAVIGIGVLALALPVAIAARGQLSTLSGTVVDQTNRVLPDVTLTLSNPATRSKYKVRSDREGRYEFVGLPPGQYELRAAQPGFKALQKAIAIADTDLTRNLQLELGSLHETITISQEPPPMAPSPDGERRTAEAVDRAKKFRQQATERCSATGASEVGGNILAPLKIKDVKPIYPEPLKAAKVEGAVLLDATIGTDGTVRDVNVIAPVDAVITSQGTPRPASAPDSALVTAAIDAVRQWEFTTTYLNCAPIEVHMTVTVNFVSAPK